MQDYRRRRTGRQDVLRALLGFVGVLFLGFVAFIALQAAWGMYGKFAAASEARTGAQAELEELRRQEAQVGAAAEGLMSPRGVEAGVRERYGVALPGEGEITIIRRAASSTVESSGGTGIFVKIFRALFVW